MPTKRFQVRAPVLAALWLAACTQGPGIQAAQQQTEAPEASPPGSITPSEAVPGTAEATPFETCPRTTARDGTFTVPAGRAPQLPSDAEFWFGSEELWTRLPADGVWSGLPTDARGFGQKTFWWSVDFHLAEELQPALTVSGRRVDGSSPPLLAERATNASAADIGQAMLAGVAFPTRGCWEVTGSYRGVELTFIVEILD